MKKLILLLILITTGSISFATDRFMSVTGVDTGTCNPTPCATFNYTQTQTVAGDSIKLHTGTYTQTVPTDWTVSGNAGAHITITPFGDGPVIVSGWNLSIQQAVVKFNAGTGPAPYVTVPSVNCGTGCITYKLINQLSNPNFFTDFYYLGVHRPKPQVNLANQLTPQGSAQICTTATTQAIADSNCNCPAEVLAAGGHCAAQAQPCNVGAMTFGPWMCFNKFLFQSGALSCSANGINIGDIEARTSVFWTIEDYPLSSNNCGGSFICGSTTCGLMYTSKSSPTPLSNAITGFQPGHDVMVDGIFEQASGGTWYLNRVPSNGLGTVVETLQDFYVFADQQNTPEDPNTDINQFFPAMDSTIITTGNCAGWLTPCSNGQLFRMHTASYIDFIATDPASPFQFEGDNYTVPKVLGLPDSTGQPLVPASFSMLNSDHITFNGIQWLHIQGKGIDITGSSNNITITGSAMYDVNAVGIAIGQHVSNSDTDLGVPNNITIFNTVIAFTGQRYPGGEPSGVYIGDAHDILIDHDEIYGQYNGAIQMGDGLNIGPCGSNDCYFMYNITISNNDLYGRCTGAFRCFATLDDFGIIHSQTGHSLHCPVGINTVPTVMPNTFCNHIVNNKIHDAVGNYNLDHVHLGAVGVYLDQGTTQVEVRNNLIYRSAQTAIFVHNSSTPSIHGCSPVDCQFMPMNDLFENNIIVLTGATQDDNISVLHSGNPNSNALIYTFDKNIVMFDSSRGTQNTLGKTNIQSAPGQWACFLADGVTPAPCTNRFLHANNIYYDLSNQTITFVSCKFGTGTNFCPSVLVNSTGYNFFTSIPWGLSNEEDIGTLFSISTYHLYDLHLINPIAPVDNFYPSISPVYLNMIGFVPFDLSGAGRVTSTVPFITVPNQPSFMIKRFVNQNTDYGNFVASPVTTYNLLQPNNKYSSITHH